ncbi:MAG: hypothetical protein HZC54_14220 [Verrucomicrobia bacterium]|nr:hypothetical protein [Verrucomicrobiota bacterium]
MKPESPIPPQSATKVSRLAIASLILATLNFLSLGFLIARFAHFEVFAISAILCLLLAPVLGVAALRVIARSSGRVVGKRYVVEAFLIIALFFLVAFFAPVNPSGPHPTPGKAKAAAAIQSLCWASKCYHVEYDRWPQPSNISDLVLIFNGLRDPHTDKDISSTRPDLLEQNPRQIRFMEFRLKDVTHPSGGANSTNALAFYDPWGMPYAFCFDNGVGGIYYEGPFQNGRPSNPRPWKDTKANDNRIPLPFNDGSSKSAIPGGFAFFSNGPDTLSGNGLSDPGGKYQKKAYENDIRSWK